MTATPPDASTGSPPTGAAAKPLRGLPDLLELAAAVAASTGARAEVPLLTEIAGRTGASRLLKTAKRLHTVLQS